MNNLCYYEYVTNKIFAVLDNGAIYRYNDYSKPIAFLEDKTWYDAKDFHPIAYEEQNSVFDYKTHQPIYYISF